MSCSGPPDVKRPRALGFFNTDCGLCECWWHPRGFVWAFWLYCGIFKLFETKRAPEFTFVLVSGCSVDGNRKFRVQTARQPLDSRIPPPFLRSDLGRSREDKPGEGTFITPLSQHCTTQWHCPVPSPRNWKGRRRPFQSWRQTQGRLSSFLDAFPSRPAAESRILLTILTMMKVSPRKAAPSSRIGQPMGKGAMLGSFWWNQLFWLFLQSSSVWHICVSSLDSRRSLSYWI